MVSWIDCLGDRDTFRLTLDSQLGLICVPYITPLSGKTACSLFTRVEFALSVYLNVYLNVLFI